MSDGNEKLYKFKQRSDESGLLCEDPSRTVQSDAVDADINVIVQRFGITGKMPEGIRLPEYGDFEGIDNYQEALAAIEDGQRNFMMLPANVRAEFDNDAGVFFNIASDPENIDYLRELGLAVPKETAIVVAPVIPPAS
ncbi:MAG: internal scaffolding protein [Microvirus sp.]|nr:MAG: internal scaffolding protein [Microvirus sp.]